MDGWPDKDEMKGRSSPVPPRAENIQKLRLGFEKWFVW